MSNSHRKGRKAYLNDYKPKKGGGYEYKGKRYAYRGDQSFKSMLIRLWAFGGGAFACMIVAGSVSPPGINGCAYVILPLINRILLLHLRTKIYPFFSVFCGPNPGNGSYYTARTVYKENRMA